MKVQDIMSNKVMWVAPDTSLVEVSKILAASDIGSVPVCQQDKVIGIITDRDIIVRCVAQGKNPQNTMVQEVMTKDVIIVSPEEDIHKAADLMAKKQIRRLPVVSSGRLVGFLAIGDMAVETIHIDEAGQALSNISQGVHH
ncbi:MAG: CBS domain-containing protein [Desulfitobacterium hafniense]|nr:CBS domain-containing protein [Desulfitobacterium hafniense]